MSVTITEPEEASSTSTNIDSQKMAHEYRKNLTRSPSIEKIIKFNTYICSQNFFILPSILAWLRTSQTVLKSYAERCIIPIKSAVYSTILYKIIEAQFRITCLCFKEVSLTKPQEIFPAIKNAFLETSRSLHNIPDEIKRTILKIAVYFCFSYIFLQLSVCLWILSAGTIPGGLIFMLVALVLISYANFQCLRFIIIKEILKSEAKCNGTNANDKYIKPKAILGNRTISHVKLF